MSSDHELRITFQPSGRTVQALPGTVILEAAARAGLVLLTPCGGGGTCGKCLVRVCAGDTHAPAHGHRPTAAQFQEGWRLACCTALASDAVIEVPATSLFERSQKILTGDAGHALAVDPAVTVATVEAKPPAREDDRPDLERLGAALHEPGLELDPVCYPDFSRNLRASAWQVHVVRRGRRVLSLQPAAAPSSLFGVAFDLGTTTVVGTLLDLSTGRERAVASTMNGQIPFGDDVLARILCLRDAPARLDDLQDAAVQSLNDIVADLCRQAQIAPDRIFDATLAGNTTMQQIVCGIDPGALGELPFTPVFARAFETPAARIGLRINPAAHLYVFPQIGGFVGGDTVAGMLASGFDRLKKPTLLVDIGTNGEIVLFKDGVMLCASTAAGPAFEGARIRQGMRATAGAIEKVLVQDGDMHINVIGNAAPAGLCGTALIDAAAELLRHGLLESTGRLVPPDELPIALPDGLRRRVHVEDDVCRVEVASTVGAHGAVSLYQKDIRELQLASGAIRAGVETLLQRAGMVAADLDAVLLAGAFGNFIRRNNAQRIGLLPALPRDRIRFIGNASSMGAKMALLSVKERTRAEALRRQATHVDLGADPAFQAAFGEAMLFPECEAGT